MDALMFVESLLGHVISWPMIVLVMFLIMRKPIRELIPRLKSGEILGAKATFSDELERTEKTADAAIGSLPVEEPLAADSKPAEVDPLLREAEANPSYVLISSWERLKDNLVPNLVVLSGDYNAAQQAQMQKKGLALLDEPKVHQVLGADFVAAVRGLNNLRNAVAHGKHNPTPGEAVTFSETANELHMGALRLAAAMVMVRRRAAENKAESREK